MAILSDLWMCYRQIKQAHPSLSRKKRNRGNMSEYQYYEFQAIDKPLDKKAVQALRTLSSRAQITPTSFVNEYNWGDF